MREKNTKKIRISPIEKKLDQTRDEMWKEAGKNTKRWFELVDRIASQTLGGLKTTYIRKNS